MLWTGGSQAMNYLIRTTRRRFLALAGATVLLAGGMGASALFTGGTADAAACTGANPSGTACTITGTLDLTGGTLTMTTPTALGWGTTITGADQLLSDPTAADETYRSTTPPGPPPAGMSPPRPRRSRAPFPPLPRWGLRGR